MIDETRGRAGQAGHVRGARVRGFTREAIGKCPKANMTPQTTVFSDGLGCFVAVADTGCLHIPTDVGALKPRDLPQFK